MSDTFGSSFTQEQVLQHLLKNDPLERSSAEWISALQKSLTAEEREKLEQFAMKTTAKRHLLDGDFPGGVHVRVKVPGMSKTCPSRLCDPLVLVAAVDAHGTNEAECRAKFLENPPVQWHIEVQSMFGHPTTVAGLAFKGSYPPPPAVLHIATGPGVDVKGAHVSPLGNKGVVYENSDNKDPVALEAANQSVTLGLQPFDEKQVTGSEPLTYAQRVDLALQWLDRQLFDTLCEFPVDGDHVVCPSVFTTMANFIDREVRLQSGFVLKRAAGILAPAAGEKPLELQFLQAVMAKQEKTADGAKRRADALRAAVALIDRDQLYQVFCLFWGSTLFKHKVVDATEPPTFEATADHVLSAKRAVVGEKRANGVEKSADGAHVSVKLFYPKGAQLAVFDPDHAKFVPFNPPDEKKYPSSVEEFVQATFAHVRNGVAAYALWPQVRFDSKFKDPKQVDPAHVLMMISCLSLGSPSGSSGHNQYAVADPDSDEAKELRDIFKPPQPAVEAADLEQDLNLLPAPVKRPRPLDGDEEQGAATKRRKGNPEQPNEEFGDDDDDDSDAHTEQYDAEDGGVAKTS